MVFRQAPMGLSWSGILPGMLGTLCLLSTHLLANPTNQCSHYQNNRGVNVQNCSGMGLLVVPDQSLEESQILDFSQNRLQAVPVINESSHCFTNREMDECTMENSSNHCRNVVILSRNQISNWTRGALDDLKCLKVLDLSHNQLKGDVFTALTFLRGVFHLERLVLNNNPLGSLAGNVITEPFLPYLRELDLSHCELEVIDKNAVDDFNELRILNLSFNKLQEIPAEIFKGLAKLEHLDLRDNQLTSLPGYLFGDLSHLQVLLLSHNKLTLAGMSNTAFYTDIGLKELDLKDNQLTAIPYEVLTKLTQLRSLDLSQNPIQRVDGKSAVINVQTLVLDNIPDLQELGPYSLAAFPALVNLSISGNKGLEKIHSKFLGDSPKQLKHIRLENNRLSTLHSDAVPWRKLNSLKVGGNPWYCDDNLQWMTHTLGLQSDVTCSGPLQVKGRNIKTLTQEEFLRDYAFESATAIIVLAVCLPIFGVCAILIWRRRRHCPCVKVTLQGQYVTLFTRDLEEEDNQNVAVEVKVNSKKLSSVSNGAADDTKPFIKIHNRRDRIQEMAEEDDI